MTRSKMPDRRPLVRIDAKIGGSRYFLDFGERPDGSLGEIFITASKYGTFTRGIMDALARVTSVALQCGAPVSEVAGALRGLNFPPNGPVLNSGEVTECRSVPDWIGREIEALYGDAARGPGVRLYQSGS